MRRTSEVSKSPGSTTNISCLLLALVLLLSASAHPSAEEPERGHLRIDELKVVDVQGTKLGKGYNPLFEYSRGVSQEGKIRILRFPTAHNPDWGKVGNTAFLMDASESRWKSVALTGWDPTSGALENPQMTVDPSGTVAVAWESIDKGRHASKSTLEARLEQRDGSWSDPIVLSDEAATDISSFALSNLSTSELQVVWTDARERHFVGFWHPTDDGYDKVFARSLSNGQLGQVLRVTPRAGKYVTQRVKVKMGLGGSVYAIWDQEERPGSSQVCLSIKKGLEWSKVYDVSEISKNHWFFDVAPLPDGGAVIFWVKPGSETVSYRMLDQDHLSPILKLPSGACCPSVVGSSDGAVHVVYQEQYPWDNPPAYHTGHLFYQRLKDGHWSDRQEISDSVFFDTADIAIDGKGRIHLFWQRFNDGSANLLHAVGEYIVD